MNAPQMVWVGYALIILNGLIMGLLIRNSFFGCYSLKQIKQLEDAIVVRVEQRLLRDAYAARQTEVLTDLDQLHRGRRDVTPSDYEKDCA